MYVCMNVCVSVRGYLSVGGANGLHDGLEEAQRRVSHLHLVVRTHRDVHQTACVGVGVEGGVS